jgi:putative membrane protein
MNPVHTLKLFLKGAAMGAADVVPGVSGGTIAFISGIYDELLNSINSVNFGLFRVWKSQGFAAVWKQVNGNFLATLLTGILVSVLTLSKVIKYLLEFHPVLIWSFFFGLVFASIWMVGKQIKEKTLTSGLFFALGTGLAFWITTIQTTAEVESNWFFFVCGAIAICAMILPGISGSFILLLLGAYHAVIDAIHDRNVVLLAIFASGCVVGLLSFSRFLKWLLDRYRNATIALLTGFLLGSLNKIWPWKENVGTKPLVVHSDGRAEWMQQNVLPAQFDGDAQIGFALLLMAIGMVLIVALDRVAPDEVKQ